MDLIIAAKGAVETEDAPWPMRPIPNPMQGRPTTAKMHPCHQAWDDCFNFIYTNFARPETSSGSGADCASIHLEVLLCKPIIDGTYKTGGPEMDVVMRAIPPVLLDVVWPVGIARFLLRDHQIPIGHRYLFTFDEFHKRYGTMIISSAEMIYRSHL